ncbi:MAG: hypothetical protein JW751_25645 [Polyangiaceae bacterium]|nr:hypothetical protein [Polyangiaceae bacterium]
MRPLDPLRLMQHYDGELSSEESAEVERLLVGDPEGRDAFAGLQQLGEFLREFADERAASADDVASSVMAHLDFELGPASRSRVVRGRSSRRASRIRSWVWGATGGLAAAAAMALLFAYLAPTRTAPSAGPAAASWRAANASARPSWAAPDPVRRAEPGPDVSIETVDFGQRNGTIFMVSSGEGATTPVIWVTDPTGRDGDPARPL